uniref:DUF19 domain-containing protein n=1 Tax=Rhabditophanes sp. KR3021 TaxID=114890 RepID=A0AC35TVN5_9BILA
MRPHRLFTRSEQIKAIFRKIRKFERLLSFIYHSLFTASALPVCTFGDDLCQRFTLGSLRCLLNQTKQSALTKNDVQKCFKKYLNLYEMTVDHFQQLPDIFALEVKIPTFHTPHCDQNVSLLNDCLEGELSDLTADFFRKNFNTTKRNSVYYFSIFSTLFFSCENPSGANCLHVYSNRLDEITSSCFEKVDSLVDREGYYKIKSVCGARVSLFVCETTKGIKFGHYRPGCLNKEDTCTAVSAYVKRVR